jgi:hypothetical protein
MLYSVGADLASAASRSMEEATIPEKFTKVQEKMFSRRSFWKRFHHAHRLFLDSLPRECVARLLWQNMVLL